MAPIAAVEGSIPAPLAFFAVLLWCAGSAAVGYVLGSLPFGYLVARSRGVNIFEVGSRNPGATNVRRVLGSVPGNLVFSLDFLKGALAAGWPLLPGVMLAGPARIPLAVAGLFGALLGHSFSCFTGFRGGKGVATAAGGFLVIAPGVALAGLVAWSIVFYAFGWVSLASIVAAVVLPGTAWLTGRPIAVSALATLVGLFVIVRHRANIGRLLAGTEPKTRGGKGGAPTT